MSVVQPLGLDGADEELGAVGVGPGVGHRQDTWASVLQLQNDLYLGSSHLLI